MPGINFDRKKISRPRSTGYLPSSLMVVPLHIGLYSLFRPNLGIVNSAIFANSRRVASGWEIDYWDHRAYLPMKADEQIVRVDMEQIDIGGRKDRLPAQEKSGAMTLSHVPSAGGSPK